MANVTPPFVFDLNQLLHAFPETADTLLLDRYLVDREAASARLFRVYQPAPAHFHRYSNEHLLVLSGRGRIWIGDPSNLVDFAPGTFICFERLVVHATPELLGHPVVFLAIDAPRRDPSDIVYIDAADGDPSGFIGKLEEV